MTKITYIPGEIANAAIDEHGNRKPVTRTQHIFDDAKGKSQAEINKEFGNAIGGLNSQNYVTVGSFNALPATGEAKTVYRVSNWDGSQQDPTVYSEYAWNGSQYVHLSTKTQIGEVFDISAYHATGGTLATYADLSAALDSNNGGGVPQSLQKGGMSVKYVRTSDNKYVQYRLMSDSFNTTAANWQGVDDEPTAGSNNLVKSGGVYNQITKTVRTQTITIGVAGKYINTSGTIGTYSQFNISAPIQVKEGEIVSATIEGANVAIGVVAFSTSSSVSQDNYTVLQTYQTNNKYNVVAPNDGYIFISYNKDYIPSQVDILLKDSTRISLLEADIENNSEKIDEIELQIRTHFSVNTERWRFGYFINVNGEPQSYSDLAICKAIPVSAGDIIITEIEGINNAVTPIAFSTDSSVTQSNYTILAVYDSSNTYRIKIENSGYIFLSVNKDVSTYGLPIVNIYRPQEQKVQTYCKNILAIWGTSGYIAADGSSDTYRIDGVSVISKCITVKKGDLIKATINNGVNSAAAPISFNTERYTLNNASAGYYTPLCEYDASGNYEAEAPNDGYIFLTFNPNVDTFVEITREREDIYLSAPWADKKWFCIGDSLTDDNQTTTIRYYDYIADKTGIIPYNIGVSGSGYKRSEGSNMAFYQRCEKVLSSTDVVTIFGSFNDTSYAKMGYSSLDDYIGVYTDTTTDTIAGCINTTIRKIIEISPYIKIGIIAPTPWSNTRPIQSVSGEKYVAMLKQVAEYNSIPFLDLFHNSGLMPWNTASNNAYYSKDPGGIDDNPAGVHPNEKGNLLIASHVNEFLKTILM